jgi:predicted GNAT family acetyltransferase
MEARKGKGTDQRIQGELPGLSILRSDYGAPDGPPFSLEKTKLVDLIYPLQEAYEREEVVPPGYPFNPGACRNGLERMLQDQVVFTAWWNGLPVAKANTNAFAYRQAQIGGVYVRPEFRGRGIAKLLVNELVHGLVDQRWQVRLFVKKNNLPAIAVYRHLGFTIQNEYGIFYY